MHELGPRNYLDVLSLEFDSSYLLDTRACVLRESDYKRGIRTETAGYCKGPSPEREQPGLFRRRGYWIPAVDLLYTAIVYTLYSTVDTERQRWVRRARTHAPRAGVPHAYLN